MTAAATLAVAGPIDATGRIILSTRDFIAVALFGVAMLLAELRPAAARRSSRETGAGQSHSFSVAFHIAAMILFGPLLAALTAFSSAALAGVARRVAPLKVVVEASILVIAVYWSGLVYWFPLRVGSSSHVTLPGDYLAAVPLVFAYFFSSALLLALAFWSANGGRLSDAIQDQLSRTVLLFTAEGCVGVLIAFVYQAQPWALPLLFPPLAAVAYAYRHNLRARVETEEALIAMADVVESRDASTARHSQRVALYAVGLGRQLGLRDPELRSLELAGRLHDLGKIGIDNSVLFKRGLLNSSEYEDMQAHPEISGRILAWFAFARKEAQYIHLHHERLDGRGYPFGLEGSEIPIGARILSIADAFDAMTTNRPYRPGMSKQEALAALRSNAGTQFDAGLVEIFVTLQSVEPAEPASGSLSPVVATGE